MFHKTIDNKRRVPETLNEDFGFLFDSNNLPPIFPISSQVVSSSL
jgi:hypothetical protein